MSSKDEAARPPARHAVERHAPCSVRRTAARPDDRARESAPGPDGASSTTDVGPVTVAAWALFHHGEPDAAERLIREHRPDGTGRCRGCPHSNTVAPRSPCVLRLIGDAAARLREHRPRP